MTPMELIRILDSGMVEELTMYYNGSHTVVNIRNLPEIMPDYEINKLWNSEDGKGISVLLADNMREENNAPTIEQPQGKWIKIFENPFTNGYVCPFCGHKIQVTEQFLPKVTECEVCGAKMDGGEEE